MTKAETNWTVDPETRRSNSSPAFERTAAEVERIIRYSGPDLNAGRHETVALLIAAQLAHVVGLEPENNITRPGQNWTVDTETGCSNSSQRFNRVVARIDDIIVNSDHDLVTGRTKTVAQLIMAQLAHVEGLMPRAL